jgi:hypothetical protein
LKWEPVLKNLYSEFPVVADASALGSASFSNMSAVPVVAGAAQDCSGEVNLENNNL